MRTGQRDLQKRQKGGFSQSAQLSSLKILSWNCCGLGNPMTVQRLKDLKKELDPDIIFLMETKNPPEFVTSTLDPLNFESLYHVPPHSPGGGGPSLLWNACVEINVLSSCDNFIDVEISYKKKKFHSTFTYGAPELQRRRQVPQTLTDLGLLRTKPCYINGDLNDIINKSEKEGGQPRTEGSLIDFRSFM